jgi:hypothetical protein
MVSGCDHLTTTTLPKSATTCARAHSSGPLETDQKTPKNSPITKNHGLKVLQTIPLSRMSFKHPGKTHHGYQQMENIKLLPFTQLTISKKIQILHIHINWKKFRPHRSSRGPQLLSKRKIWIAG